MKLEPIDPAIIEDFDPQYLEFYDNVMPKMKEAEQELLKNDPNMPKEMPYSLKYIHRKIGESDIPDRFSLNVPLTEEDKKNFEVKDDRILSFDGKTIPVKIYRPVGYDDKAIPVHFNFHGGGFMIGGLYNDANLASHLCLKTKFAVIDVDYRMCPDYAFPYPLFDSYSVIKYVHINHEKFKIVPDKLSCGGISAGGQISLGLAHLCRDGNIPLKLVLSNVPPAENFVGITNAEDVRFNESVVKYRNTVSPKWVDTVEIESFREKANHFGINVDYDSILYEELDIRKHPEVVNYYTDLFLVKNFKGLPRHVITTGGVDILKDGGKEYAKLLADKEVDIRYQCASGCPHVYFEMRNILDKSQKVFQMMVNELKIEFDD